MSAFLHTAVAEVTELNDFITATIKHGVTDFLREFFKRRIDIESVMLCQRLDDLEIVCVAAIPSADRTAGQADMRAAHDPARIKKLAHTEAITLRTGAIRIVERKKDVIISAGMNVYPREVEEVLHQHSKIVEAAVIGVPSKVREEVVKAYIVVEEGEEPSKSDVVSFCRDKLSKFKIPRQIEIVDELPKSAMGKILRRVLREQNRKE